HRLDGQADVSFALPDGHRNVRLAVDGVTGESELFAAKARIGEELGEQEGASRTLLARGDAQIAVAEIIDAIDIRRIARGHDQTLPPAGPFDPHEIEAWEALDQAAGIIAARGWIDQVQAAGDGLARQKAMHAARAAVDKDGKPALGLACRPLEQWVMAAGNHRRRCRKMGRGGRILGRLGDPQVNEPFGEKQLAGQLTVWNALGAHEFVNRPLAHTQIVCHLAHRQQIWDFTRVHTGPSSRLAAVAQAMSRGRLLAQTGSSEQPYTA